MKVPQLQSNRVAEGQGQLAYLQTPSNLGQGWNALAGGLRSLGGALTQFEGQLKERDEKTNRFNALTALNDFESETNVQQTELKRNADPTGKDFAKTATELYDKRAEDFLISKVPQDLREEFRYRLSENRQRALNDAYDFQYKAGDAWFRKGVEDQLIKAGNAVGQDPDSLETWQKKMDEVIAATDLSEIEKAELRDKVNVNLAGITYFQKAKREALTTQDTGIQSFDNDLDAAKALIRKEEAYAPHTYWDTTAHRTGYGSDTITRNGKHIPVRKGDTVTREEAENDLTYRLQEREGAAVRKQLGDQWNELPNNVRAALYSVGYNYGSLPSSVVKAVKSGDMEAVAQSVEALGANKTRRKREAAIIRGSSTIDRDPRFESIPFDDRVQMRKAAESEARSEYNALEKEKKAQNMAAINDLHVGLLDGTKNALDIQKLRDDGVLTDYDDIAKANKILAKRDGDTSLATSFTRDRVEGRPFDPTDKDEKKKYNAWVGPEGLNKLAARDSGYFQQYILSPFSQIGATATDVSGLMQGMVRGSNPQNKAWALDALAQMRDANPDAFAAQFPTAIQRQVDQFDDLKGSTPTQEELLDRISGGNTQQERDRRKVLETEADSILAKTTNGIPAIDTIMEELKGSFDTSYFGANPHYYSNAMAAQAVETEFQQEFKKEYSVYGDVDKAKEAAFKTIKSTWGVSAVGDGATIMKYPPQMVGYQPSLGSYDWINQQVRQELKLAEGQKFELVSDDKTRQEFEQFRAGTREEPPSYRVMITDENGVTRDARDAGGIPRIWFQKPEEVIKQEQDDFDVRNTVKRLSERLTDIVEMHMMNNTVNTGKSLPDGIIQEEKEIREQLKILQKPVDQNPVPNRMKAFKEGTGQ